MNLKYTRIQWLTCFQESKAHWNFSLIYPSAPEKGTTSNVKGTAGEKQLRDRVTEYVLKLGYNIGFCKDQACRKDISLQCQHDFEKTLGLWWNVIKMRNHMYRANCSILQVNIQK